MTTYDINLSTTKANHLEEIMIRQDDVNSQTLKVSVFEHEKPVDLSKYEIFMESRPDGYLVQGKVTDISNLKNGKFSYVLEDGFWQKLGINKAWFSFKVKGTEVDSTQNFKYIVIEGPCRDIQYGNSIYDLDEILRKVKEMANEIDMNYEDFKERLDVLLEMFKTMNTYSKEEIDRMLIKLIAGEKISATFTMDYKNKVAGSLVENPNIAKWVHNSELLEPNATSYNEFNQSYYNLLTNGVFANNAPTTGARAISIFNFNFYEDFKRKFPSLFPANNNVQSNVESFKKIFKTAKWGVYCKGSSSAGNKATMRIWNQSSWVVPRENNTDKLAKLQDNTVNPIYINEKGILSLIVYAEPNDGKTTSVLQVNNPSADYTVELSLRDIFATKEELEAVKSALTTDIANLKTYVNTELAKKQDKLAKVDYTKLAFIGSSNVYFAKNGRDVKLAGIGDSSLPKTSGSLLLAIPTSIKPVLPPSGSLQFTLDNADSTPTNITIVKVYADRMEISYRNNDKNVTFDKVSWLTDA
ncbi:phage baseplate upper protein [Carnobacterium divergens]|uniref:Phage baseplate upper protein n=1 Tax=Carnobacterium divergens TaxID=2748 RepID=A0AAW8R9V0_CARDV|nr:BppU family phage baseplate upper protein [Carnobacterium divergens]MDT1957569.1 phage baseplate upper protein [Carnobacterium divergens]MDT1973772.1 phage baseplate upper protein [Carnobacterium divergens]